MGLRDLVLSVTRVPPTPEPPPGSPPRVFRAAPNFFTLLIVRWALTRFVAILGLVWAVWLTSFVATTHAPRFVILLLRIAEGFAIVAFLLEAAFGWMVVRLDYEMRWYMLSDRALRIREGVITVREKTVALANIQNIAVRQGPLQRYFGIADVEVKTAGGGGDSSEMERGKHRAEPMHVALFRGVDNASEIRDLLREGVRRQRNAGLGDPDEHQHHETIHDAASAMLAEARALRAAVQRKTSPPAAVPPRA